MNALKRQTEHVFSQIPQAEIQRSVFDRTHGYKTSFNAGYLVPFYLDEVLPGDSFDCDVSLFARMTTPVCPFMDNLHLETFFFFVPNRIIWDNWERFNGAQDNPNDSTAYTIPTVDIPAGTAVETLPDYFGIPVANIAVGKKLSVSALPFRAYNLIWNEWFRDENLQNSVTVRKGDTGDVLSDFALLRRGKRHDYFTSCLPWPQKGPSVEISIGDTAPVMGILSKGTSTTAVGTWFDTKGSQHTSPEGVATSADADTAAIAVRVKTAGSAIGSSNPPEVYADLSSVNSITINQLREAVQIQRLYERDARGGSARYFEILNSHFGVVSPDSRLQRPEYLGGNTEMVQVNSVVQTSATDSTSPQGNLAATGTIVSTHKGFTKSFVEHGWIIGLVHVRADLTYQQGLARMWSRRTRFDYYWPALAHLGEQAVLSKEIYADGNTGDDTVFGYQERWAEYRYFPSQITGKLNSKATNSLDVWHLAQNFASRPVLNASFIEDNPPISRVLAVQNEPAFIMDSVLRIKAARPMPVYSVPGLVDHF